MDIGVAAGGDISASISMTAFRYMMPPRLIFGSPVQRSKARDTSFWHIPISVKPRAVIGPASLGRCRLFLDKYEDEKIVNSIRLLWGDAVFENVALEANFHRHDTILAPVVMRKEGNDGRAFIVDNRHIKGDDQPYPLTADRTKCRFRLRVVADGKRQIVSPHFYQIRVPDVQSNGHFVCEIEYQGEGIQP